MDDASDKITRLYSRLNALKVNLPQGKWASELYVRDYHSTVNELQSITGSDLSEFKVPENEVSVTFPGLSTRHCERNLMMMKVGALLGYFDIKYLSSGDKKIGFRQT